MRCKVKKSFLELVWLCYAKPPAKKTYEWKDIFFMTTPVMDAAFLESLFSFNSCPLFVGFDAIYNMQDFHFIYQRIYQFEMPLEVHVSGKNRFLSTLIGKSREIKEIYFPHYPFKLPANQHSQSSPDGPNWLC